ncbi:MAG: putative peptide maturation dehydrogenase [Rhodanobacteraceae bacterium]
MRIRRCAHVLIELRERLECDLARIFAGGTGLAKVREWIALAAHLDDGVVLTDAEIVVLGDVSPDDWIDRDVLVSRHPASVVDALLDHGLLVSDLPTHATLRAHDDAIRASHWRGIAAVLHRHTRWHGVDSTEAEQRFASETDRPFLERLGPPEPLVRERDVRDARISLTPPTPGILEDLVHARVTCRNFDNEKRVTASDFATIMFRTFGARATSDEPGIEVMKRAVPSAGGLHPTEAYLLIQHVEGVTPGLYHYHPGDHALEPLRLLDATSACDLALHLAAGQRHFRHAHVMIVYASRFHRTFWKYQNHMKAYRAVILDVGHLSQTLYLAAAERGLAAFITAAVNERDIEETFGLDPMSEGVIAIGGFGHRAATMEEAEFDPLGVVWSHDGRRL